MTPRTDPRGSEPFELESYLRRRRKGIDAALAGEVRRFAQGLPPHLAAPMEYGVLAEGKRLRPILCVAAWEACRFRDGVVSEPPPAIEALAASVELVHAYSLMHDDLPCMDDAPLRRGRATPHTIHGVEATAVAGAALIPAAAAVAWRAGGELGLPDPARRELVGILTQAAGAAGMVGGQGLDLLGEGRRLGREELDDLHGRKTGALLTASLLLGGVAAEVDASGRAALDAYGRDVGLAFQIADDVLDATGDAQSLGKAPSDAALEKSTYVARLGVDKARAEASRRVVSAGDRLEAVGLATPALRAIARYVVERDR